VAADGALTPLASKAAAYTAWKAGQNQSADDPNPLSGFTAEQLREELARREGGAA
jgi:hypothetical protein